MKRALMAVAAVVALSACTPIQLDAFERMTGVPIPADDRATLQALPDAPMTLPDGTMINPDGSPYVAPPPTPQALFGICGRWHDTAIAAGFSEAQWPNVNRIMYRESRCQPEAYNRSGASGLMQIMRMWADDCGGTPAMLFDGAFNLRCAVHILATSGWRAWSTS